MNKRIKKKRLKIQFENLCVLIRTSRKTGKYIIFNEGKLLKFNNKKEYLDYCSGTSEGKI